MALSTLSVIFSVIFVTQYVALAEEASGQKVCSVVEPTSGQVCVSIKFPWKDDPVFFCTEQANINYVPQCTDPAESHHCPDDARNDTLKIATPWDCCPIISTPNKCSNTDCPPAPYNRSCKVIRILGDCCPTYFCDSGEPDNCKTARLRLSCMNPPKNKINCTAFRDPYGCCNKYQCAGEGKAGICPRQSREGRVTAEPMGPFDRFLSDAKQTVNKITKGVKSTLEKHDGDVGKAISNVIPLPFSSQPKSPPPLLRCSGDNFCPDAMKCCHPPKNHGPHSSRRRRDANEENEITDGICVEPDPEDTVYESTTQTATTENSVQNEITSTWTYTTTTPPPSPPTPPPSPPRPTPTERKSPVIKPTTPVPPTEANSLVHE